MERMLKHRAVSRISNHEDLFMQRYDWLMNWALRLTENDRHQAEDLVHDVFMHFIVSRPSLDRIQHNIDGYLYTMLKNLHVSEVRRTIRIHDATRISDFSLTDYDSIENGLKVLEEMASEQVHAQIRDQLCRLCHYACIRKESSKAGSVLLLRFFHGYYPEEIARITKGSRQAVEKRLQAARTEARVFLEDPTTLSFMHTRLPSFPSELSVTNTPQDFMEELRRVIWGSRAGACSSRNEIERLYDASSSTPVDQRVLSHFVSCADCLDTINRVLGLAPLADRIPMMMTTKDTRKQRKDGGDGPSGAQGGGGDDVLKKVRRKVKDLLGEHPLELRISVNGFILGSQSITSSVNRLTISVKGEDRIGFVEIFTEKEVRLLFSCVEPPPDGPLEFKEWVALSNGRTLEMILDFSNSTPDLHLVYIDPTLGTEPATRSYGAEDGDELSEKSNSREGRTRRGRTDAFKRALTNLKQQLTDWRFWFRPGPVTALLALVLISAFSFLYWRRTPVPAVTAADLLQRSAAAEESIAASGDQVVHRTVQLEEKLATGQLIERQRIEIYQSANKGITARRLYDESGALVAGDWRRSDGVQTLYHHGAKPQLQQIPDRRKTGGASLNLDQLWLFEPSAKDFSSLIGNSDRTVVEDRGTVYFLNFEGANETAGIVKATLTLSKSDLHATELVLVVRVDTTAQEPEDRNAKLREVHFIESGFERRVPNSVTPSVFEPDPELLSFVRPEKRSAKAETITPNPGAAPPAPIGVTPEIEVEVLERLNHANAFLGEQLSVTHDADGRLRVEGVVDTPARKAEILSALGPVTKNRSVRVVVETVAEALARQSQRQQQPPAVTVQGVEVTENKIAVDAELRRYLQSRGLSEGQLDLEMRRFT